MEIEKLKVIAEGMGLFPYINTEGQMFLGSPMFGGNKYNPLTNNDQMVEIMEKLPFDQPFDKIGDGLWKADGIWKVQIVFNGYVAESQTINEAVCNAAYEYFNT